MKTIKEMIENMKLNGIYSKSDMKKSLRKYSNFSNKEINEALLKLK